MILKGFIRGALNICLLALITSTGHTAKTTSITKWSPDFWIPTIEDRRTVPELPAEKTLTTTAETKRTLASAQTFSESDLSSDFKKLRDEWLKVQDANQFEALLKTSYANFSNYSADTKYFVTQMHIALPLRGIVWRMRPLFENGGKFIGNQSTHVLAVQMLRSLASGIDMFLPTEQGNAGFKFFTEPSSEMSLASQFKTVAEFQNFLVVELTKKLIESSKRIETILESHPASAFVWDNKMQFGTGAFRDDIQRYIGHGEAEMKFTLAAQYKAIHDILVFCAYNQNDLIQVAGKIGAHLGHDSVTFLGKEKADFGITDQERINIIREAAKNKGFLELRDYANNPYGTGLMKRAYTSLSNSVLNSETAYKLFQGKKANPSMGLNPIHFSPEAHEHLERAMRNMEDVVKGVTEVRDPVSGKSVTLNLPAFYNNPPKNLNILMANQFDQSENEKLIKSKNGETLRFRNYYRGQSVAWNNEAWKNYVPSASGKDSGYMKEARRIMRYSLGTSLVMNLPAIFVN